MYPKLIKADRGTAGLAEGSPWEIGQSGLRFLERLRNQRQFTRGIKTWAANSKFIKRVVKFSVSFSHLGKKPEGWSTEKGIQRTPSPRTTADSRERHSSKQEHEWQSAHRTVRTRGPLFVDSKNRHLRDSLPLIQGNRMYPEKRSLNPDTQCLFLHSIYKHYTLTKVSSWVSHSMLTSPVSSPLIQNDPTQNDLSAPI